MRLVMKFLHTMGAIGLMGAMACLVVILNITPAPTQETLAQYALLRGAMGDIAKWLFLPSLALTLLSGLFAIAITRAFHNAGWAWVKLATGVVMFEWGFVGVQGPMQQEAELSASALRDGGSLADLGVSLGAEAVSLWVLLGVATLNVVLGIWRPRLTNLKD